MRTFLSYLLAGLAAAAMILSMIGCRQPQNHRLDERISFRKRDKIPYGTFVAYENLQQVFPQAGVIVTRRQPGYWDELSSYDKGQALIIISPAFNADEAEMKELISFVESGNNVFISTMDISDAAAAILHCAVYSRGRTSMYFPEMAGDTLRVSLTDAPFGSGSSYLYPGRQYDGYFSAIDTTIATVLGHDKDGRPDFIRLKAGQGNLYIHLAPMAFTNYFLLHRDNIGYYEKILSLVPEDTRVIGWDEYYINKRYPHRRQEERNWLSALFQYRSFRAALWIALLLLLLYALLEMRRKQRYIPVIKKPKNDSLDFVRTIGRLYHDKGDHANLSRKMAAYFLEHVRNRYKLSTTILNDEFVRNLHIKTEVPEEELLSIVSVIRGLDGPVKVNEKQLSAFHKQLESFYKKA